MRRLLPTLAVLLLVAVPNGFVRVEAQEEAQTAEATADKDGWWSRVPVQLAPLTGPTFPEYGLAVSSTGPEITKIAAIGITIEVPDEADVTELVLVLEELSDPAGSANPEEAVLSACPATTFWGEARNGDWEQRAAGDCNLAKATGERSTTGSWFFDLTPMAKLWTAGADPLEQNGVVIVPEPAPAGPPAAQVGFGDISTGTVFLSLDVDLPEAAPPPPDEPTPPEVIVEEFFEPFEPGPEPEVVSAPTEPEPPTAILNTERAVTQRERITEPNILGNLPWVVLLLMPVALGAALLLSYLLGPAGEPAAARRRSGAVSRALEQNAVQTSSSV